VLCGLDGNDRINGRGGNDIIDAGAGKDVVDGDVGNDRIDGGAGTDSLYGQGGADLLSGGSGLDILQGGAGGDRVYGDAGDDDLSGGAGGDYVDGGAGFNVCDQPGAATDQQIRCVIDESKPVVENLATVRPTVDVSAAAGSVRIEAHVIDDTGVTSVQIYNSARLVSGTSRDGIWATTIQVPRYITPGPRDVDVHVRDRVGRSTSATLTSAYTVLNTVSDQEMPVLQSMSLSTTAVDVRSASKPITATIKVTDDLAGATDLVLCPAHAFPSGRPNFRQADACVEMEQSSGTPTDSTWKATYVVPKGAPSGIWNFEVWISDAAGNAPNDFWFGPDELAAIGLTSEARYRAIPDDAGVFSVQGTAQDLNAPGLTSLNLNPSTVDTSTGAVQVTADIAGTDIEGITGAHLFIHGYAGYPDNTTWTDTVDVAWVQNFQLVRGTPQDGVWHATFVVPGGTPEGSYFIQVALEDSSHFESWVSPDSGWTTDSHLLTPELAPTGNHLVVLNS
jgi:hypothetical protein